MNVQPAPKFLEEIDRAVDGAVVKRADMRPSYGGPQRDAINSCVDNIVGDLCEKIDRLHKTLDTIQQKILESAAASKHRLNEHVANCVKINDEILHMQDVIADIQVAANAIET